jgi:hypothetical protein
MAKVRRLNKHTKIKIDDKKWRKIQKEVNVLKGAFTAIGIHEGTGNHTNGSSIALIAHTNEFGASINVTPKMRGYLHGIGIHLSPNTTTITIPERSWMRSWFDKNQSEIQKQVKNLYGKVLDGKLKGKQALALLGAYAEGELKKSMVHLREPGNHPVTIERKGSSNPLIDTGRTLNEIKHKEFYGGRVPR